MKRTGWVALGLVTAVILLSVAVIFILHSGKATARGNEMNYDRAVFNVTNAVTLTGFRLSVNVSDYKALGQLSIFALIVSGSLVTLLVGGWALTRAAGLPYDDQAILRATLIIYGLVILIGATILIGAVGFWPAIFDSASAFGNSGHWLGTLPTWDQWFVQTMLLPLGLLGGLGIPVLLDLASSTTHFRSPSRYNFAVIVSCAILYILATGIITTCEMIDGDTFRHAVSVGSTEVINSRSLGLPLEVFNNLSRPSQWVELLLMLIGASPGGTGGGIGTVVVFIFLCFAIRIMKGQSVPPIFGLICIWIVLYLLATLTTTILLISAQPQVQADRLMFLAVSAIGNVGTSHEPLTSTGSTLYILSSAMFFGRFAPLAMLWWAGRSFIPRAALATK